LLESLTGEAEDGARERKAQGAMELKGEAMKETQESPAGLVCRECGGGIEFDLWHGTLGPLCERCHEKAAQ
jgi:hypothetical protein